MLGIEDGYVALAYVLCIASTLMCVVYGIVMWNKGDERTAADETKGKPEKKAVQ
jgi:hypothetical protein